jgi:hypothetical protein
MHMYPSKVFFSITIELLQLQEEEKRRGKEKKNKEHTNLIKDIMRLKLQT